MTVTTTRRPARSGAGAPLETRVVPAPRTEPPHDGELAALGIVPPPPAAPLLPLNLPTGAQVRPKRRRRAASRGDWGVGSAVGVATADPTNVAPTTIGEPFDSEPADTEPAQSKTSSTKTASASRGGVPGDDAVSGSTVRGDHVLAAGTTVDGDGPTRLSAVDVPLAGEASVMSQSPLTARNRSVVANEPSATVNDDAGGDRAVTARLVRLAVRRVVATCIEILGGYRPVTQLRQFCAPDCFDKIADRLLEGPASQRPGPAWRQAPGSAWPAGTPRAASPRAASPGAGIPRTGIPRTATPRTPTQRAGTPRASVPRAGIPRTAAPPRAGRLHQVGPRDRVTVRRVQVSPVSDEVVEVVAVLCRRDKVWAMAVRLELFGERWLCTYLELV